jgi:DNA-binding transcriptional LysR family regulator
MDLTLRQIRFFVAVADAGKVSLAGSALGVSQSAITESLQALESKIGVKLVKRHSRGVNLTQEGYQFLSHARNILASVSDATRMLTNAESNLKGFVRLGVPPTVAGYLLSKPLAHFHRVYPSVQVELTELPRSEIEQGIIKGNLDVAIMVMMMPPDPKRIDVQTILSARRRLWLAPNHRLLQLPTIRLSDVAKEPYFLLTTDDNTETTFNYWQKHGLKPQVHFYTVSIEAVRNLVAANLGVTILSDLVYRPWSLEGDRIEARVIADKVPDLKIGIAWKKNNKLDVCARTLRDFFLEATGVHIAMRETLAQTK